MSDEFDNSEDSPLIRQMHEGIRVELIEARSDNNVRRASAANNCPKKRQYQRKGAIGSPMQSRSISSFATGDLVEHKVKNFIFKYCVGPGKFYSEVDFGKPSGSFIVQHKEFLTWEQETVITKFGALEIPGHGDGWGKRNSDGKWEYIEIKSSSDYGFNKFLSGNIGDYPKQAHVMMLSDKAKSLGVIETRFVFERKETSHLADRILKFDPEVAALVEKEYYMAEQEIELPAPYPLKEEMKGRKPNLKPTGRMIADYPCSYCPFVVQCHGVELDLSSGKPVYVLKTKKDGTNG